MNLSRSIPALVVVALALGGCAVMAARPTSRAGSSSKSATNERWSTTTMVLHWASGLGASAFLTGARSAWPGYPRGELAIFMGRSPSK